MKYIKNLIYKRIFLNHQHLSNLDYKKVDGYYDFRFLKGEK